MKKILLITAAMTLCVAAAHAATINATQSGPINASATWGGTATPTEAGNTDTWNTNGNDINVTSEQFYGGLLQVTGGSELIGANNIAIGLQATTFDGGGILHSAPNFTNFDLNGQTLTFASGGADFNVTGPNNRGITFNNAVWAGSGAISFVGDAGAGNRRLSILADNTLTGYTGTISVSVISSQLIIQAPTTGSFGVNIGTGSFLHLNVTPATLTFASLVLGGDTIAPGTYSLGDFTAAQQAFFTGDQAQVTVIPEPAAIGLIFFCGLAAILIRRRLKA